MKKVFTVGALCVAGFLFVYYRLPSLLAHYVAYTYDQGRDFIAASNIILLHKIPFIGPTTGINGLFHGSWWYYLLAIPYIVFNGAPIGFYWFNFLIQFLLLILLMIFLKKEFGLLVSTVFGLFIAIAPYFNFMSLFVGNNSMVLPSLLVFLICNFYLFKHKNASTILLFITGFSLALVGEFELSFGIFLIPLYFLGILLFKRLRQSLDGKAGILFLSGLTVGFLPRILFEIKNSFSQTKVLIGFLLHPKLYNSPAPYLSRLSERWILFQEYYFSIFTDRFVAIVFLISMGILLLLTVLSIAKGKIKLSAPLLFYGYLLGGLFFLCTLYKDFFWKNYYEGIQYIFIFIFISLMGHAINRHFVIIKRTILFSILFGLVFLNIQSVRSSFMNKVPFDGLQVHEAVVSHIMKNQDLAKDYCLRVYTPSVIPHTYNYLFLINRMKPSGEWKNGTCWFIVEADSYKERRQMWLDTNEPKDKNEVTITKIKDVEIRHYKVLPKI